MAKDQGATKYPAPRGQRPPDSPRMQLHLEPQLWVKTEGRHGEMMGKSMEKSWEINGNHGHVMESRGKFSDGWKTPLDGEFQCQVKSIITYDK